MQIKDKLFILFIAFSFLVSTTGLPIWSHYCEMMGNRSSIECGMCETDLVSIEETSCCSETIPENQVKISDGKSECCIDEFDYKKIEDSYSQSFNTLIYSNQIIVGEVNVFDDGSEAENKNSNNSNNNLPPPKFGKHLLFTIHQLKINFPVC